MALSVIQLENIIDGEEIASCLKGDKKITVVCPNPAIADELRESLSPYLVNFQTLTIAKFTSDLLKHFEPEKEVMRKSELKLLLSTLWKIRFQENSSASFEQCFDILTDLRSYTLESHLVDAVLECLSDDISECIRVFWLIMKEQEITDEHLAYDLLTEHLEKTDIDDDFNINESYVFIGFSHLSSNQINFLRALARRFDVDIPIGKRVLANHRSTDWTAWLTQSNDTKVSPKKSEEKKKVTVYRFPKGNMGDTLKSIPNDYQNIVFPVKSLNSQHLLELPTKDFLFKIPNDLAHSISTQLFDDYETTFFYDVSTLHETATFLSFLEKRKKKLLVLTRKVFSSLQS